MEKMNKRTFRLLCSVFAAHFSLLVAEVVMEQVEGVKLQYQRRQRFLYQSILRVLPLAKAQV
jgi:hypothetical protein